MMLPAMGRLETLVRGVHMSCRGGIESLSRRKIERSPSRRYQMTIRSPVTRRTPVASNEATGVQIHT